MLFPFSFRPLSLRTIRSLSVYTALLILGSAVTARADLSWTTLRLSTGGNQNGLAFSPERSEHVMVGANGTIFTSRDAVTWKASESTVSNTLTGAAWGAQQYVVVGQGGTILTSPDAINWTLRLSGTSNDLLAVSWIPTSGGSSGTSSGQFVAVGADGTALTSPTGQTWTKRTTGVEGNNTTLRALTLATPGNIGTGMVLVVGDKGTILTSPDAITWTQRTSGTTSSLTGVAWGGGTAMAVGASNTLLTSTTLAAWTVRSTGNALSSGGSGSNSNFNTVSWGADTTGGRFIVGGTSSNSVISSTDGGLTWKNLNLNSNVKYVTWTGAHYIILGPTGRTFVSDNGAPPGAPLLKSPADSGAVSNSPKFEWYSVAGAGTYHLQVATNSAFSPVVTNDTTLQDTGRTVSLAENADYYWRVRSRNAAGFGPWSTVRRFHTLFVPPPAPMLSLPGAKATSIPVSTTLQWAYSNNASGYAVQLATDSAFTLLTLNDSTLTTAARDVGPLSFGTTYFWRVKARNTGGFGAWSSIRSFATEAAPTGAPGAPILTTPAIFSTGVSLSPAFAWTRPSGAVKYQIQLSTVASFATMLANDSSLTQPAYATSGLTGSTNYYWRVRAGNSLGFGSWSEASTFTTVVTAPSIPALVSPAAFATGVANPTLLTWAAATGATTYQVQLSTASDFSTLLLNDSNVTATTKLTMTLPPEASYYWRVRARNSAGTSGWASTRRFNVAAAIVLGVNTSRNFSDSLQLLPGGVAFRLQAPERVNLRLLDMNGRNAVDLADAVYPAGLHEIAIPAAQHGDLRLLVFRAGSLRRTLTLLP